MLTNDFEELVDRDRRAVVATVQLVADLAPIALSRPTPCDGWTVYDLIAHMTGQHIGFAAAARGRGSTLAEWVPSAEPYAEVCTDLLHAFQEPGVQQRGFALPEIRDGGVFPAPIAISFHLVDNVVHAWDLAVATQQPLGLDPDVVTAGLRVAEQVPNGPERMRPGAAFAPARAGTPTSDLERTLLLLGRDPARWPVPSQVSRRTASR